jgi:hypothetical protein
MSTSPSVGVAKLQWASKAQAEPSEGNLCGVDCIWNLRFTLRLPERPFSAAWTSTGLFARILYGVALTETYMRKVLILAAGLALIGTSAWSQSSSRDDDRHGRWQESRDRWDRARDRDDDRRGRAMRDDDDDRSGRGARFFLRSGDTQLRVACGDEESTQACVDAALRMFDRVQSQPRATTSSPAPAPTPP